MKFESQFNATFRNAIEKMMLLSLVCFDYEFAREYIFHDNQELSQKNRYYKFLSPSKLLKRIQVNYEKILQKEKENDTILGRIDKELYGFFLNPRVEEVKSFLSHFTHTHDMNQILHYYSEEGKFDLSLKHGASSFLSHRIDYCLEFLLWFFTKITAISFHKNSEHRIYDLAIGYISVLIKVKYSAV